VSQKLTIESLGERTLMMVTPLLEGRHLGLHLREFGICVVYNMNTFTTQERRREPYIGKKHKLHGNEHVNQGPTNR
jgi:hypothetical protein